MIQVFNTSTRNLANVQHIINSESSERLQTGATKQHYETLLNNRAATFPVNLSLAAADRWLNLYFCIIPRRILLASTSPPHASTPSLPRPTYRPNGIQWKHTYHSHSWRRHLTRFRFSYCLT